MPGSARGRRTRRRTVARPIEVDATLELVALDVNRLTLRVDCSAGFYVRSLAHDLGERLGTGGSPERAGYARRAATAGCAAAVALEAIDDPRERTSCRRGGTHSAVAHDARSSRPVALTDEGVKRARVTGATCGRRTCGPIPPTASGSECVRLRRRSRGSHHRDGRAVSSVRAFASLRCPGVTC